jgi:arylsulfatase
MVRTKPNFILIIADQMRGDCLGADGNRCIETPHLDELAARGCRFAKAYSAVPSCIPARASLWTGQNQWHTGILGMGRGQAQMPSDFPHTLAGELATDGYRTHSVGKGHFYPSWASMGFQTRELEEAARTERQHGYRDDYRHWFYREAPAGITPDDHGVDWNSWMARPWHTEERLHPTAWTMTRALRFLDEHDPNVPFLLNISFQRPHSPYVPPRPYFDMYEHAQLPEPYVGDWAYVHDVPSDAVNVNAWRGKLSSRRIRRARAGYYGEISFIDTQIGRLRSYLTRYHRRTLENTWFIFVSDHGDMQGDHHLWRKTYAYEGSARIPMLVAPPETAAESVRATADSVVELRDIMPTVLEAAGLPFPDTVDGASMLPIMQDANAPWRTYLHGEHCTCYSPEQEMQYVTDGKRKYIWLPRIGVEQFFDLQQDPGECTDLAADSSRQEEMAAFRAHMVSVLERRGCGWVQNGNTVSPPDEPLVSPYKTVRWNGRR